jgi:hypothetical protein
VSFGIALFLTELSRLARARWALRLSCWRQSRVSFTACGACLFSPAVCDFQEPVGNVLSTIPFVGALFAGPAFGIGILPAGVILAIMIIPYIAAVMRDVLNNAGDDERVGLRHRLHHLGGDLAHRLTVHQKGDRRRDARSGPRAG